MKAQTVIIINGVAESGKDTFVESCMLENNMIMNISSIDIIKSIAKSHFMWDGKKDTKGRQLLSALKDATTEYNDFANNTVKSSIHDLKYKLLFVHVREVSEINKLVYWCKSEKINVHTLLIERPDIDKFQHNNTGDLGATQKYNYDFVIYNDSTFDSWYNNAYTTLMKHIEL